MELKTFANLSVVATEVKNYVSKVNNSFREIFFIQISFIDSAASNLIFNIFLNIHITYL